VALLFPRYGSFNVTPKGDSTDKAEFDWRNAMPMLLLYALALGSLFVWPSRMVSTPSQWGTIAVAGIWNLYNLIILSAAIAVAYERPQRRQFTRIRCSGWVAVGPAAGQAGGSAGPTPAAERIGELIDLSEGGAHVVLDTADPVPEAVRLTLTTPSGVSTELEARVVVQREEDGHLRLGLQFMDVTPRQRIQLIEQMFSEPDNWLRQRFAEDKPVLSAINVLIAPLVVAFNHLTGRNPVHEHKGSPLTPFHSTARCPECYSPQLAVLKTCDKCGAVMPPPESEETLEAMGITTRILRGVRGLVALPLIALAVVLAVGWQPIVDPLNAQLDEVRERGVITRTRVGELTGAHRELRRLARQLEWAMVPIAPALPLDWSKRLWSSRYGYELDRRDDPDWMPIVMTLDSVAFELEQAGRDYRGGASHAVVKERLEKAQVNLEHAAIALRAALAEEEQR
jgi:hypothetical protein